VSRAASPPLAATARLLLAGSRPRTLPAAVVPVVVGVGLAAGQRHVHWAEAALALVVSLAIQVGTNYANDYSDGVRGTDAGRIGPARLVGAGLLEPKAVRAAALAAFSVAAVAGLALCLLTSPYLLIAGAAAIAAGWLYTGGPRPYGYLGLGEAFVFVFFGLFAVTGTAYVVSGRFRAVDVVAAVPVGLLAVALLVVNNLRDIESDEKVGKRTLAVLLGPARTRRLYELVLVAGILLAGTVAAYRPGAALGLAGLVVAIWPLRAVHQGATGRELVPVLAMTGGVQLVFGALLALGVGL
jgi:1,4-dihydroxy-2-naphthoate octaprenyltransferase